MTVRQRTLAVIAMVVAMAIGAVAIPSSRIWLLQRAGWALVAEDALAQADVIVLTPDAGMAETLEAADLVQRGIASRIAIFAGPPDPATEEFRRRGLRVLDRVDGFISDLAALGVVDVVTIPFSVSGTEESGPALVVWCRTERCRSIVVVCSPDHSRRVRRVFRRAMKDQRTRVIVRPSHYSAFNPDEWWRKRAGLRTQIEESQKLLLDLLRHPLS